MKTTDLIMLVIRQFMRNMPADVVKLMLEDIIHRLVQLHNELVDDEECA